MLRCLCVLRSLWTHGEVEALGLLLIGPSLADVGLAHVGVGRGRLHRLCGLAVLEGLGHVEVLHCEHVMEGLHGCIQSLLHLTHKTKNYSEEKPQEFSQCLCFSYTFVPCFFQIFPVSQIIQRRHAASSQRFDWHAVNNRVISFLAWSSPTWKINYVSSTWDRQEGSVSFYKPQQTHSGAFTHTADI